MLFTRLTLYWQLLSDKLSFVVSLRRDKPMLIETRVICILISANVSASAHFCINLETLATQKQKPAAQGFLSTGKLPYKISALPLFSFLQIGFCIGAVFLFLGFCTPVSANLPTSLNSEPRNFPNSQTSSPVPAYCCLHLTFSTGYERCLYCTIVVRWSKLRENRDAHACSSLSRAIRFFMTCRFNSVMV